MPLPVVYVFFHIFTDGPYQDVIREMLDMLRSTGLEDEMTVLYYGVVGDRIESVREIMDRIPKAELLLWGGAHSAGHYERLTLHEMHTRAVEMVNRRQDAYFFYMHTKGVSKKSRNNPNVHTWRRTMLHSLATYRHTCWRMLDEGCDAVGIFSRRFPLWHYSGNMWWTTPRYLTTLPVPIGAKYLDPEMWIGLNFVCAGSLGSGPANLYCTPCAGIPDYQRSIALEWMLRPTAAPTWHARASGHAFILWDMVDSAECRVGDQSRPVALPSSDQIMGRGWWRADLGLFPTAAHDDPFPNQVKEFRLHFRQETDARPLSILEGGILETPPPHRVVPVDRIRRCRIECDPPQPDLGGFDATDRVRWSHWRFRTCALTNTFFGIDPFVNHPKQICFHVDDGLGTDTEDVWVFPEADFVIFV